MEFTPKLKERFCMDCKIPIKIFQEPYFTDRLRLLDDQYDTLTQLKIFESSVLFNDKFHNEQDYFSEYNRTKDSAIDFIKSTDAYQKFNESDMNRFAVDPRFRSLPGKDIFRSHNVGRRFISIDMRKANFSALHYYNPSIFGDARTWEEFIGRFTDVEHIIRSKYVRQVVMGNCNCKRHITYEKYLMSCFLATFLHGYTGSDVYDNIVFFSNDEVVFDITDLDEERDLMNYIKYYIFNSPIPYKAEAFTLHKFEDNPGYYKEILEDDDGSTRIEFKCVDNYAIPFIIRKMRNEPIQETDKVFIFEGRLAKFMD